MFTGLVTDLGHVVTRGPERLRIATGYDTASIDRGASIACDGVCLTVTGIGPDWFEVDLSTETLARTTLGDWTEGRAVNLERSLRVGDELGGHIVSGHVDGTAQVVAIAQDGDTTRITLDAPGDLARFIAPKGSVALNGTSLTVNTVEGTRFGVHLIPHTRVATSWAGIAVGDRVNLEVDTLARYVARLTEVGA